MDIAKTLIRCVMRAFYSTQEILIIDALVQHSCLRDDDLGHLMKLGNKDLHKACAGLRDARFLVVHTRPELQAGKTRPQNKTYYYIDYRQTIDAIKWRVYKTDKDMQGIAKPSEENKEYVCPRVGCESQWSQMEVLDSVSARGFTCQRCGSVLEQAKEREAPGHQQLSRMNNQFKFMTDMLQEVDKVVIPECNFDLALANARPIVRLETHEVPVSVPVDSALNKPSAVKGLANTGPKTMQVIISTGDDDAEQAEAARKRQEELLRQNALPEWITASSVPTTGGTKASGPAAASLLDSSSTAVKEEADGEERPAKKVKVEIQGDISIKDEDPMPMSFKMEGGDDEEDDLEFEDVM